LPPPGGFGAALLSFGWRMLFLDDLVFDFDMSLFTVWAESLVVLVPAVPVLAWAYAPALKVAATRIAMSLECMVVSLDVDARQTRGVFNHPKEDRSH
jgi:hypothetical protein